MTDDAVQRSSSPPAGTPSRRSLSTRPGCAEVSLRTAVEALEQELIACQRLATLGNLAAMAAHEFRNLMTPVVARCEAALTGGDVAFMRKALERAVVQAQRAIAVSRHLIDLAHGAAPPAQACGVAAAVREALETMTRPLEKDGIALHLAVPDDLCVSARPELFGQVLLNLLLNAREAMKDTRGTLTVAARPDGGHAEIEVRDSGKGFPPGIVEQVLNPFLAADPHARPDDWQAVGLGLSVCRMIAWQHGARIRAERNDGPGCTFRLRWPLAGAACQGQA